MMWLPISSRSSTHCSLTDPFARCINYNQAPGHHRSVAEENQEHPLESRIVDSTTDTLALRRSSQPHLTWPHRTSSSWTTLHPRADQFFYHRFNAGRAGSEPLARGFREGQIRNELVENATDSSEGEVVVSERLGGLLKHYHRSAA